jgi:7-keto-8-aminopelargonate synthetase-like enzyme
MTRDDASVVSTVASRDSLEIIVDAEKPSLKTDDDNITNSAQTASHAAKMRRGPMRCTGLDEMSMHMMTSQGRSGVLFRRFDKANVKVLLGMEREIADLEEQLQVEERKRAIDEEAVESLTRRLRTSMREYCESLAFRRIRTNHCCHRP